jgi:hypothetical protein
VALLLATSLTDFSQSQAKTMVVDSQHTKHDTAASHLLKILLLYVNSLKL